MTPRLRTIQEVVRALMIEATQAGEAAYDDTTTAECCALLERSQALHDAASAVARLATESDEVDGEALLRLERELSEGPVSVRRLRRA